MAESQPLAFARPLPQPPNLDKLKKEAKRLLTAIRAGDPAALARLDSLRLPRDSAALHDAQLVLAREYGFPSWRAMTAHVNAQVDAVDELLDAVQQGDTARLAAVLDEHASLVNAAAENRKTRLLPTDTRAMRLIHVAVAANQPAVVRMLLDRGADPNVRNVDGRTPLHDSIELGRSGIEAILLGAGAEMDVCSAAILGHTDRLRELLVNDATLANDMSTNLPPLGWAAFGLREDSARALLEFGATFDRAPFAASVLGPVAAVAAADILALLLNRGLDPNWRFDDGDTLLHRAIRSRMVENPSAFVRVLLDAGYNASLTDVQGRTALDVAVALNGGSVEDYVTREPISTRQYDWLISALQETGGTDSTGRKAPHRAHGDSANALKTIKEATMNTPSTTTPNCGAMAPQFLVDDLEASIAYYRDKLGFTVDFTYGGFYAGLSRGRAELHLKHAPKTAADRQYRREHEHLDASVAVKGIEALYAELQKREAEIIKPLESRPWGTRDFYVSDLDGYIISFGE